MWGVITVPGLTSHTRSKSMMMVFLQKLVSYSQEVQALQSSVIKSELEEISSVSEIFNLK